LELFRDKFLSEYWKAIKEGIENFYFMNDFIFTLLLFGTADYSGAFNDVEDLPFMPLPYHVLEWRGSQLHFNDYLITPNRTLVVIYDLQ